MSAKADKDKTDKILAQAKKRMEKKQIVDVEEESIKIVIFTLSGDYFAFYGDDIKYILPYEKTTLVPGTPDIILGIINVRGDIESVINIHKLLRLPDSEITKKSRITIAEKGGVRSGILVDSVDEVKDIPKSAVKPPISTIEKAAKGFVSGEILFKDNHVTVLDVGKIFKKITE